MRNLLGRLVTRTNAQLSAIAAFWDVPITHEDPHRDAGLLYPILTDPWAIALAWERLPLAARQILQKADSDHPLREADLAQIVPDQAAQHAAIQTLVRAGLLFVDAGTLTAPSAQRSSQYIVPAEIQHLVQRLTHERTHPLQRASSLDEVLDTLTDAEALALAEHLGMHVMPATTPRDEALTFCRSALQDPAHRTRLIKRRTLSAQRLWEWIIGHGGTVPPTAVQHALGLRPGQLYAAIRELADYGLLWRSYTPNGELRLLIPAVLQSLAAPSSPPVTLASGRTDVVPLAIPFAWPVAWDVMVTLQTLEWTGGRWQPTTAPAPLLQHALPLLWLTDQVATPNGYLAWLCQVCTMLGLLTPQGQPVLPAWERWRRLSFAEQTRRLTQAWVRANVTPTAGEPSHRPGSIASWPAFKRALLATIRTIPARTWHTLDSVIQWCLGQLPEQARLHAPFAPESDEYRSAQRAIRAFLRTSLHWLGVIEQGQASDGTAVVQLGDRGCWLLGLQATPPTCDTATEPATFTPDGRCVLDLPQHPSALYTLLCLSEIERRGPPLTVRFSRKRLTAALHHGWTAEHSLTALRQAIGDTLPETFVTHLQQWLTVHRPATLRRAYVIDLPDAESAATAMERLERAGFHVAQLDKTRLCIWATELTAGTALVRRVQAILRAAGLQPVVD